jgi:hypothetical protein
LLTYRQPRPKHCDGAAGVRSSTSTTSWLIFPRRSTPRARSPARLRRERTLRGRKKRRRFPPAAQFWFSRSFTPRIDSNDARPMLMGSTLIALLFCLRDRLLAWQKGLVKW